MLETRSIKGNINHKNFATGLFYIIFGVATAIGASRYQIGTASRMGPGYFPLGVGLALTFIGLCVLIGALKREVSNTTIGVWPLRSIAIVLLSVVFFGIILEPLGLVVALIVLLSLSSRAHPQFTWRALLFSIIILVPSTWVVFVVLLGLQFPLIPVFFR